MGIIVLKEAAKKVLGVEDWETIEAFPKIRRVYSFLRARSALMRFSYPQKLILELTTRCNSACTYCPHFDMVSSGKLKVADMDRGLLQKIVVDPLFPKLRFIVLAGQGEPTLYPHLRDALEFFGRFNKKAELQMFTNGIHLDAVADDLVGKLGMLTVSLNSFNSHDYLALNRVNAFNQVLENTKEFLKLKGNKKPVTRIQLILADVNLPYVQEFKRFWSQYLNRNDYVFYQPIINMIGKIDVSTLYSKHTHAKMRPCMDIFEALAVSVTGDIYPCCAGTTASSMENKGDICLGNAETSSLSDVVNGKRLRSIRHLHLHDRQRFLKACSRCDIFRGKGNAFVKVGGKWR